MAPRKPWIGGNWKCNGTVAGNKDLIEKFNEAKFHEKNIDVVIFPTSLHCSMLKEKLAKNYEVGIQNVSKTGNGAFTGEISIAMVDDFGVKNTLIGHSERRQYYNETDAIVAEKVDIVQKQKGINAIICIGETLEEREKGITSEVVRRQIKAFISKISDWKRVVLAYEPVWAIGTGKVSTPEQAEEAHNDIRKLLKQEVSDEVAKSTRIVYGGSVNEKNCKELICQENIDGFLVGGASLKETFTEIISTVETHFLDSQ